MSTPLTEEQQLLLSAWLDGEVTDSERQIVEQLLEREETRDQAREYLESLRATSALVTAHASVRAPVGLSGRVMGALESEFKPKASGPGSEPFGTIPMLSWRAPLYAAAAAVVVSLAIMFGPSLVGPSDAPASGVARTALDNLESKRSAPPEDSVEKSGKSEKGSDALFTEDLDELRTQVEKLKKDGQGNEGTWDDEAGRTRRAARGSAAAEGEGRDDLEAPRAPAGEPTESEKSAEESKNGVNEDKSDAGGLGGGSGSGTDENRHLDDDAAKSKELKESAHDAPKDEAPATNALPGEPKKGSAGSRPANDAERKEQDRAAGKSAGGESTDKKSKSAAVPPPPSLDGFGQKDARATETTSEAMSIDISDANTIAAQTDVLWISSLYGSATIGDEGDDTAIESVTVEVDADKLPELLAALRKLARDQGYGDVEGLPEMQDRANTVESQDESDEHRISGYLPTEATQPENDPAEVKPVVKPEASPTAEEPARVKLVIRLK